jgi:hypothetical protein
MSPEPNPAGFGLLLSDDLIFASRIIGTARDLGFAMRQAKTPDQLISLATREGPHCVIVDLGYENLVINELVTKLQNACAPRPRMVAYGSHVDTKTLQAAREAGCAPVLARSKFVEYLPKLLPEWMAGPTN